MSLTKRIREELREREERRTALRAYRELRKESRALIRKQCVGKPDWYKDMVIKEAWYDQEEWRILELIELGSARDPGND